MQTINHAPRLAALIAIVGWLGSTAAAWAVTPAITLSPIVNHPSGNLKVSGTGFGASAAVDIYFDTADEALAVTDGSGNFSNIPIGVPGLAAPGTHYVSAVGRRNGRAAQQPFTVNTDWAKFHFNVGNKGANPYENVLWNFNVASLDVAWTFATGSGVQSSPAVVGGTVYVGSSDSNLYAFNAITGAQLWTAPSTKAILSSPAVANGVVFFGSSDGVVYAYNVTTGNPVWAVSTGLESQVNSSPAVTGGRVYVGSQNSDSTGSLYSFNAATGAVLWQWTGSTGDAISSSPAVANGVVYVCSNDGYIRALDAAHGTVLWQIQNTSVYGSSSPAVANGVVYVGSPDGNLYAFNAKTGAQLWSAPTGGSVDSSPAVVNGIVYVSSFTGSLYAINAVTGSTLWTAIAGDGGQSSPAVANGVVYVGGGPAAKLYAFDASSGAPLWAATTGGPVYSSPAVVNGMVYVGSNDDSLYAYALNGGNNSVYHAKRMPPKISTLQPDWSLKPQH